MKEALRRGLTSNTSFQDDCFRVVEEETDQIYLNDTEQNKIYNLDLSQKSSYERVRDLFIIVSYTGLRFSDLIQIKAEQFINNATQLKTKTQKTGLVVIIPLDYSVK
jgi:hypothetical protein